MSMGEYISNEYRSENLLKLTVRMVSQLCEYTKNQYMMRTYSIWVNYMVYKLYLNKATIF